MVNPDAYKRGTMFVQCAGCEVWHKLVDNLGLMYEFPDLEKEPEEFPEEEAWGPRQGKFERGWRRRRRARTSPGTARGVCSAMLASFHPMMLARVYMIAHLSKSSRASTYST